MPFADKLFLAELALFGGAFGTGSFMIFESSHTVSAWALAIVGVVGIGASLLDHFSTEAKQRNRFLVTAVLGAGIWILLGYNIYLRLYGKPATSSAGPVLLGWGSAAAYCNATINGSLLMPWSTKFDLAAICGVTDPTRDKYEDTRITVTPGFSIHAENIVISVPFSSSTGQAVDEAVKMAAPGAPNGTAVQLSFWIELFLIPKNTDLTNIHRISDVARYGGVLVPPETPPSDTNENSN